MGFPTGYTFIFLPKLLILVLTLLDPIRNLMSAIFHFLTLRKFPLSEPESSTESNQTELFNHFQSVSTILIRELLPVVKYSELVDPPESCAVCLYDFDAGDETRRLANCRHVFHRCCLDRWMDHNQKTCPLCRTPFVPEELQDSFNERLWVASGIGEYYGGSSVFSI